ncbi:PKD domain-containing protein [Flammeovirgaceae bacterium SG7u.111]|nr:PKD domain-containing protein [Flammeovirgaceae bacterium SG7u.132]WPO33230.1 PKD domain-containing protein [Flammeovirgaceae bacterium SG7u.111]
MKWRFYLTKKISLGVLGLSMVLGLSACEDELPGVGSIPDKTPPKADFTYKSSVSDYKEINFTNLSISSLNYSWDFGDGSTSNEIDPTHFFAAGEGTYTVKLVSSDGNEVSSDTTIDVVVVDELVPEFQCPSFECSDRSVWGSFSGSGSPTPPDGSTGAKLESSSHYLDQTIKVSSGTKYKISFWYVSASSSGTSCGNFKLSDGDDDTVIFVEEGISLTPNASDYVGIAFEIETTAATKNLRFQLTPGDVTGRYDLVKIEKLD